MKSRIRNSIFFLFLFFFSTTSAFAQGLPSLPVGTGSPTSGLMCIGNDLVRIILDAVPGLSDELKVFILQDGPWYDQKPCQFQQRVFDPTNPNEIFGERYTYAQVNWIIQSLRINLLPGLYQDKGFDWFKEIITQKEPSLNNYAQMGAPGIMLGTMAQMFSHPPVSFSENISSTLAKFDLAPSVSAQGYGYRSLGAIQALWEASRNTAYILLVLILLASGFMVMFRVKINPQTAITLQLLIPKLIITMILIAFSYAIAGLVIELVYVAVSFIIAAFSSSGVITNLSRGVEFYTGSNLGKMFLYYLLVFLLFGLVSVLSVVGPIISLVMIVLILFLLFRVWWMMLKSYIMLLFLIITGPWQIMLGLLPGNAGFGGWFRNVIAQASVFAVVPLMFLFNMYVWQLPFALGAVTSLMDQLFMGGIGSVVNTTNTSFPSLPFFGAEGLLFSFGLGYAILALIPKTADIVRDALKAPAFKYGAALGEAIAPVPGGLRYTGSVIDPTVSALTGLPKGSTSSVINQLSSYVEQVAKHAK